MTTQVTQQGTNRRQDAPPTIVKNAASSHFTAVDLVRGEALGEVGQGKYPHTAVFHPNGAVAYLVYISSAHIEVVDLASLETIQRIEDLGLAPVGSALGPNAEYFFLGTAAGLPGSEQPGVIALAVDDDGRLEIAGQRPLGRSAGMRIGPDGLLYVAQQRSESVRVLSADDRLIDQGRYPTGVKPHDMYVLPSDGLLAVNNVHESFVTFLDLETETVSCQAQTGANPHGFGIAEAEASRYAIVPAREDDRIAVVDLDAAAAGDPDPTAALVDVGTSTGFVDATPDGRYAVLDSYDETFVTIFDLADMAVVGRVEVGGEPLHVVFEDGGQRCYVGNMARSDIAVLDTAPLADNRPGDVTLASRITGLGKKPSGIFRPEER